MPIFDPQIEKSPITLWSKSWLAPHNYSKVKPIVNQQQTWSTNQSLTTGYNFIQTIVKSQARPSNFYPRPAKGGLQTASTFFDASVSVCQRSMQSGVRWPWLPGLGGQLVMLPGLCSVPSKPQHLYKLHVEINGNPNTNNVSLNLSTWSVSAS